MKFGATLEQRSAPRYAAYNVNYNELKEIIKSHTAAGNPADPVAIPGAGSEQEHKWKTLEDELFPLLIHEHERAANFIRSKYGEFERRLLHLGKQVKHLQRPGSNASRRPIQQTRRFQSLVQDIHLLGDDIQAVIRFANVQRTAFRKILKKYKKWTGSSTLQQRFYRHYSNHEGTLQPEMTGYMRRLSQLSTDISALLCVSPLESTKFDSPHKGVREPNTGPPAKRFKEIIEEQGSPLLFDNALGRVPLGKSSGRAVYWIAKDYIEEVTILILRYMKPLISTEDYSYILFDNLHRFIQEQNATPISQLEDVEGTVPSRAAMGVLCNKSDALVSMADPSPNARQEAKTVPLKRKDVVRLFDRQSIPAPEVQKFLAQHRDIKPHAMITSRRSRFYGNTNSAEVGTWALLDTDVAGVKPGVLPGSDPQSDAVVFPHAVLQIRWEFSPTPQVIRELDNSYLVERVRGFCLDDFAVYAVCKPDNAPLPLWQPVLDKDIRKLPLGKSRAKKTDATRGSPGSAPSSTDAHSENIFSSDVKKVSDTCTPATSVTELTEETTQRKPTFNEPPRPKRKRDLSQAKQPIVQRYWNEFDDGSEAEEDTYALYINPDKRLYVPGAEALFSVLSVVHNAYMRAKTKLHLWVSPQGKRSDERQLLLLDPAIDGDNFSSSSDDDMQHPRRKLLKPLHRPRDYHTARVQSASTPTRAGRSLTARQRDREKVLKRTYYGLVALSYLILAMATLLRSTGRRKAVFEVDAGVTVGVVAAGICVAAAVTLLYSRKKRTVTIRHRCIMALFMAGVVAWGMALLIQMARKTR